MPRQMPERVIDPLKCFDEWFQEASNAGEAMPEKMVLATATKSARPSARFLLYKFRDERRFYFFTNYNSRKSRELQENPQAAMAFYWDETEKQVRLEGRISRATPGESDAYWKTRPRESQLGAWASAQSSEISGRADVEKKIEELRKHYADKEIPRPEFWGGYFLEVETIELWTGRQYRVHDREVFKWDGKGWKESRLSP